MGSLGELESVNVIVYVSLLLDNNSIEIINFLHHLQTALAINTTRRIFGTYGVLTISGFRAAVTATLSTTMYAASTATSATRLGTLGRLGTMTTSCHSILSLHFFRET